MRIHLRMLTLAGALVLPAVGSSALPQYAAKEKKACTYCHVKTSDGAPLNPRGNYYAAHNHSFVGYDEAKVMGQGEKKSGPPAYTSAWKVDLPPGTSRVAVADVAGDKKPRVLAAGDGGTLTIYTVANGTATKEATVDLGEAAKSFVVGQFAKGKPAIIAAPGAIVYREGDSYKKKDAPDLKQITGVARFPDGEETIFYYAGMNAPESWSVDLSAANPIVAGRELQNPGPGAYRSITAHLPADVLAALGAPESTQKIGAVGFLDPRNDDHLYAWLPTQEEDSSYIVLTNSDALSPTGGGADLKPVWKSPKLAGKIVDLTTGTDPVGGKKPGFFVLEATGDEGKGRTLEFFALD